MSEIGTTPISTACGTARLGPAALPAARHAEREAGTGPCSATTILLCFIIAFLPQVKANVWPVPTGAKYHGPQAAVGGAPMQPVRLWTSTLKRTVHTARHIEHPWLKLDGGGEWHQVSAHAA